MMKKNTKEHMTSEAKTNVKNSVGRLVLVGLSLLFQAGWIVSQIYLLNQYSAIISFISSVLALVLAFAIYGTHQNSAFKMPWIILILAFPVFGLCIYVLFGTQIGVIGTKKRYEEIDGIFLPQLQQDPAVTEKLEQETYPIANQCYYLKTYGGFPVYGNTRVEFYSEAADGFEAQLKDLENAREYIFMEYHAIEEAQSFARLKDVLARKAAEGVEVRLFYDDVGSIGFLDSGFIKRMEEVGVQCRVFNPVMPVINMIMNNRDHRKITVIDGKVGFTGGYNLADEYFNITHPYGRWKDTGIRMEGDAVRSLTVMFLEMWHAMEKKERNQDERNGGIRKAETDLERYLASCSRQQKPDTAKEAAGDITEGSTKGSAKGSTDDITYVQPYADSPLDNEPLGENVYLNLIKTAREYLYVMTPYLIISDEMNRELGLAAKRGVDVRIITPGIPDKKVIYQVTRSYYGELVDQGVRIFEYTPGFVHAKQMVCDGKAATVGTINLDFRSLYHHFENGALLYGGKIIAEITEDFRQTFPQCREVTEQYASGTGRKIRLAQRLLRFFSPLL